MSGPRRPVRPARTPTSRPRRVAGTSRSEPTPATDPATDPAADPDAATEADEPEQPGPATGAALAEPEPDEPKRDEPGPVEEVDHEEARSRRPLVVLVAALVLLLGVAVAEVVYLASEPTPSVGRVTEERPVQLSDLTVQSVVDQAASAADLILSASSTDYDAQVEQATATMTDTFAEEYRQTKDDVREEFVAADTEVTIDVSAQGVVSAGEGEVVALVFLTQTTRKGTRGGVTPVQYRVTVTMVDTADGWLVSDLKAL